MITFTYEFTKDNNCIECKKRLGFPIASNKCIYDIEDKNIITVKVKNLFDIIICKCSIKNLTKCCGPNLIYYITPIATLHKKLLL